MKLSTNDPIADLLTRMRNQLLIGGASVRAPHSKVKQQVLDILKARGFISGYEVNKEEYPELVITMFEDGSPSQITGLERISKPGRRVYVRSSEIPRVMAGRGVAVVSTSKGMMDGAAARKAGLGGELICKVW